jgi:monoamine oxidase
VGARILLHERVNRVEPSSGGKLRIVSQTAGQIAEHEFDFVVVALPNNLLPTIEWGGQRLADAMRRHHAHYNYPAHYLRISILFARPFWRQHFHDSYFMVDAFDGCCLYDESSRSGDESHGVLGWLLGGDAALRLSACSDEELVRKVIDSLPACLQHGRDLVIEARVHRWVGAVNGLPAGYPAPSMDARHLPDPVEHPNLLTVGDYLFDSTLNGVLDSANFAAEWLAVEMEEHSRWPTRARGQGVTA